MAVYSFLNARFTIGDRLFEFDPGNTILFFSITAIVFALWETNRLIQNLHNRFSTKVHPLIIHFFISIIGVICISILVLAILYYSVGSPVEFNWSNIKLSSAFGFRVNLFLNTVNAVVFYINKSRKAELENEIQQKLLLQAQHQGLRNQINPHFLFNSLNALASLVRVDVDRSEKFIERLSEVYRYLLEHQETDVVTIAEEMKFIEAYLFLLKTRFDKGLDVQIDVNEGIKNKMIAPGVLQILIENAVKHNVVSPKKPLFLSISMVNDTLVVTNSIQQKIEESTSAKIGLNNIIERYKFLSDQNIGIAKTTSEFTVSIPLLNVST